MREHVLWQLNERSNGEPGRSPIVGFVKTEAGTLTVFPSNLGHLSPDQVICEARTEWPQAGLFEECELYMPIGGRTAHAYPVVGGQSVLLPGSYEPVNITWEPADGGSSVIASVMIGENSYARVFVPDDSYIAKACAAHIREKTDGWGKNKPVPGETTACFIYYIVSGARVVGYAFPCASGEPEQPVLAPSTAFHDATVAVIVLDGVRFAWSEVFDNGDIRTIRLYRS